MGRGMPTHIKLYGGKKERFEEIKNDLRDELGYEPTNPEVIGIIMARYTQEEPEGTLSM